MKTRSLTQIVSSRGMNRVLEKFHLRSGSVIPIRTARPHSVEGWLIMAPEVKYLDADRFLVSQPLLLGTYDTHVYRLEKITW